MSGCGFDAGGARIILVERLPQILAADNYGSVATVEPDVFALGGIARGLS
jgi:hypothetical protein